MPVRVVEDQPMRVVLTSVGIGTSRRYGGGPVG